MKLINFKVRLLLSIPIFVASVLSAQAADRVVVIGAGLSGLSAAYRLHEKGLDVDVYEARSRVGGRVFSAWMDNPDGTSTIAEFGAQNVSDGGDAEHLRGLAAELGLELETCLVELDVVNYQDGKFHDVYASLRAQPKPVETLLSDLYSMGTSGQYSSMQAILDELFPEDTPHKRALTVWVQGFEGAVPSKLWPRANWDTLAFLLGHMAALSEREAGGRPSPIPITSFVGGNSVLPLKLASLLEGHIHLGKALESVQEGPDGSLELYFEDGTHTHCDRLILSIPAPVYADIAFDPNVIAPERLAEFARSEPGSAGKILVPASSTSGWPSQAVSLDNCYVFSCGEQSPLTFYLSGPAGEHILANKDELFAKTAEATRAISPDLDFPDQAPLVAGEEPFTHYGQAVAKGWVEDRFSKGSYSSFGNDLKDRFGEVVEYRGISVKAMFAPVDDRVFFIGEHTTITAVIGTMEAAVESGERIAELW